MRAGRYVVTDDPMILCQAGGIEAIIETTGDVEHCARVAREAIRNGKHVILMNAEVDASIGPILKVHADRGGVVYTYTDGARFIVSVTHLKSKGSACDEADALDGQGNCNQVRVNAATDLMNFLATDPTGTGDPDILLIGDYNSYAMEDPITAIKNAGFTNLIYDFLGPDAYSYVFDGQWGYLDHALGSFSIVSQVTGVADYHINSDEPSIFDYNVEFKNTPGCTGSSCTGTDPYAPNEFRVSDHDPLRIAEVQPGNPKRDQE